MSAGAGIPIVKMSGAGNDFVVLDGDAARRIGPDIVAWVRAVCRRGISVGADGVLVVEAAGPARVRVTFRNPDGGEAFCGNGSRCAARFAYARGLAPASMTLLTAWGEVPAVVSGGEVRLELAAPVDRGPLELDAAGRVWPGRLVDAGVPHFVVAVADLEAAPLPTLGPLLRSHPRLGAAGANVDFVARLAPSRLAVRTFERGVENETLACGSGAVAAALCARLDGAGEAVAVVPRSGIPLVVELPGDPARPSGARLVGEARFVFEGILSGEA